jgi:hypothetical protein
MMPLANYDGSDHEQKKNRNFGKVPAGRNSSLATFSLCLPFASNHRCCGPRVAVVQVTRSHGSSQVGGFWKVPSLISGCKERGMTARSWRAPRAVFFALGKNCQCESGVDSLYCGPRDVVGTYKVDDPHPTFVDLNSWEPEQHPGDGDNQKRYWDQGNSLQGVNGNRRIANREQQHQRQNQSDSPCKTGAKNLHVINLAAQAVMA